MKILAELLCQYYAEAASNIDTERRGGCSRSGNTNLELAARAEKLKDRPWPFAAMLSEFMKQ